jgi:hypothetical protein
VYVLSFVANARDLCSLSMVPDCAHYPRCTLFVGFY